jgi:Response regulator containing CheY-like receiver, AAA-type ATPase, and DNA-binding domains
MEKSTDPFALVVDDDALILMHAAHILNDAGFRCHEAGNGAEAIRVLQEHSESIILLFSDVEMPGDIDGFALARRVADEWPHIEIVISSGRLKPAPGDMPERATFISKPFDHNTVHDHLRRTLPDGKKPEPLIKAV